MRTCSVDGCDRPIHARGYCSPHYHRARRHGDPLGRPQRQPLAERLWAKVTKTDTCWRWTGATDQKGYGQIWDGRVLVRAHRAAWELLVGPIPEGLVLDHLCHTPGCVRPDHLRPVSPKQNTEHRLGPQANSTSGVRGVTWHKKARKWMGTVGHGNRAVYVGLFATVAEAEAAVVAKRNELHTHNDHDRA